MPKRKRLTKTELAVLLDAATTYETEAANFEEDKDDKRLEAIRSAMGKIYDRL